MTAKSQNILRTVCCAAAVVSAAVLSACMGGQPETVYSIPEQKEIFQQQRFVTQSAKLNTLSFDLTGTDKEDRQVFHVFMRRDPVAIRIDAEYKNEKITLLQCGSSIYAKNAKGEWRETGGLQLTGSLRLLHRRFFTPLALPEKITGNARKGGGMIWALDLRGEDIYTETLIVETDKDGNIIKRKELLASGRSMKNFEYKDFQTFSGYVFPMTMVMTHDPEGRVPIRMEYKAGNCKVNCPVPAGLLDCPKITPPEPVIQEQKNASKQTAPKKDQNPSHKTETEKP